MLFLDCEDLVREQHRASLHEAEAARLAGRAVALRRARRRADRAAVRLQRALTQLSSLL